jgi:hypothetical protein
VRKPSILSSHAFILVTHCFEIRVQGGGVKDFTRRSKICVLLFQDCRRSSPVCQMRSQAVVKFQCFLESLLLLFLFISALLVFLQEVPERDI